MTDPLNKLCKWRSVLAGWHRGSASIMRGGKPNPGVAAMRDLMDKWLIMRAEATALSALLIEKGVFTPEEFHGAIMKEAALLDKSLEKRFPGFRSHDDGMDIYDIALARKTMEDLGFPP